MKTRSFVVRVFLVGLFFALFGTPALYAQGGVARGAKQLLRAEYLRPNISVTGYFHGLPDGKWTELESTVPHLVEEKIKKDHPTFVKRSRESLALELNALGADARAFEKMSRDEMEELLDSYKAMVAGKEAPSLYDGTGNFKDANQWAAQQLNYFKENYVYYGKGHTISYSEPFNESVKSMRVLVVRRKWGLSALIGAAKDKYASVVTLDVVPDRATALEKLNSEQYDVILLDYVLTDGNGFEVAMRIREKTSTPIVAYSFLEISPTELFQHNMIGSFPLVNFQDEGEKAINYLSNIVATGKAFPNGIK